MYYPTPWWARNRCSPDDMPWKCIRYFFGGEIGEDTGCTWRPAPSPPGCVYKQWESLTAYFTNFTFVEERTVPDEFIDTKTGWTHWVTKGLHPWNSPGAAPTFGNGCGVSGGNPLPRGCLGEGVQICTKISIIVTSH